MRNPSTTIRVVALAAIALVGGLAGDATAPTPVAAQSAPAGWTQVTAGTNFTCGIRTTGRLYCWGDDFDGQLGNGPSVSDAQRIPVEVVGRHTDWVAVDAGATSVCGRRATGRLYCWGDDFEGQLGDGPTSADRTVPTEVAGRHTDWRAVSAGASHTCAVRADGSMSCWGRNDYGQVGAGFASGTQPVPIVVSGGHQWTSVGVGGRHTCGRRRAGDLFCWGYDVEGQLGRGGFDRPSTFPVPIWEGRTDWVGAPVAGHRFTCARRRNATVYCWGADHAGELGDSQLFGSMSVPFGPFGIPDPVRGVAAGELHACAVQGTGRLSCWGTATDGRLGSDNPGGPDGIARLVGGGLTWAKVAAGTSHTCGITTAQRLHCWGSNSVGQLGDGTLFPRSRPVAVRLTPLP